jgi:DNA modification methylase
MHGRRFIGIEIERKYFDIAKRRIQAELAQGQLEFEKAAPPEQGSLPLDDDAASG